MSYVQRVLLPGETIIHEGRLHWLIYGRAVVMFVIACILAAISILPQDEAARRALLALAAVAFVLAILDAIAAALRRATTEFAVTDHRIIYKRGLISRFTIEMSRDKVESVDVRHRSWAASSTTARSWCAAPAAASSPSATSKTR